MFRVAMLFGAILPVLVFSVARVRAEDTPAPVCDCKPMTITVRSADGRAFDAVSIKNFSFSGNPLTVNVGDMVTWTNNDSVSHTATSDTGLFDTGTLSSGASASFTFSAEGTYPYHCNIHPFMKGAIKVVVPGVKAPALTNLKAAAVVDTPFTYTITATGTAPITYSAVLPSGFQLLNGVITGTFTVAGNASIAITATNAGGSTTKNLVVKVAPSDAPPIITGTWNGTLKSKHFDQTAASARPSTSPVTLAIVQTGTDLAVTVMSAGFAQALTTTGQSGHGNLSLLGSGGIDSVIISGHLDKKGTTISGKGIRYNANGDEEFTFSAKKQ